MRKYRFAYQTHSFSSNATVEDNVQQNAAEWTLFNALAYLIPAIFADIVLGNLSPSFLDVLHQKLSFFRSVW